MVSLLLLSALYFLPAILGRDKADSTGIFLLNLFLGWTVVGWFAALFWACASDRPAPLRYVPVAAGPFCSGCGTLAISGAHYCAACGRAVWAAPARL
jgi:hypothetical protein